MSKLVFDSVHEPEGELKQGQRSLSANWRCDFNRKHIPLRGYCAGNNPLRHRFYVKEN